MAFLFNDSDISFYGLIVFVVVQMINIISLIIDFQLARGRLETITQYSVGQPIFGVFIILFELISVTGLAIHFIFYK